MRAIDAEYTLEDWESLELQRVDPDHHTGWRVAPGRIAYSHSGYQVGHAKSAVATGLPAREFQLVRVDDGALGEVVLRAPIDTERSRLGDFQRMDFSAVDVPGTYVLRAGGAESRPFRIGADVWERSIWKTLK